MLKENNILTAGYNLVLIQNLNSILDKFKENRIGVILLKGAALLEKIYPDISTRPMSDLDLLVKKEELKQCQEILEGLGFRPKPENSGILYVKAGEPAVCVDLHTEIPYLQNQDLIREQVKDSLLPPEENLIYLCYHLAVHHGYPFEKWVRDIELFIDHYKDQLDWEKLVEKIKKYRLEIPCYYTLKKAGKVIKELKPGQSLRNLLFKKIFEAKQPIQNIDYLLMVLVDPLRLFSFCFPSVEFMEKRYALKRPAVYLFYIFRPSMLLVSAIKAILSVFGNLRMNFSVSKTRRSRDVKSQAPHA
ncbi:nucleotidyltransferase family protein [Candidatus Margulisiibacteriota bacterium]